MTQATDNLQLLAARMWGSRTEDKPEPQSLSQPPVLFRSRDAAKLMGVHEKTLLKWPIQRFEFGGVVAYRRADLELFAAQHIVPPSDKGENHGQPGE